MALPFASGRGLCYLVGAEEVMITRRQWAVGLLMVAGLGGCAADKRRFYDTCTENEQCDSGLCWEGHCSSQCVTSEQCGGGICLKNHCLPQGAPCDDGDPCTLQDRVTGPMCTSQQQLNCGEATQCQSFFCKQGSGCAATALNVGQTCEGSEVKVCASGGIQTGGCKCAVWQSNPIGPLDKVALVAGKTTVSPVGVTRVRAMTAAGSDVTLAGSARLTPTSPAQPWLAQVNAARQGLWSRAISWPQPPLSAELLAVVDSGGLQVAAGVADNRGVLVNFASGQATLATKAVYRVETSPSRYLAMAAIPGEPAVLAVGRAGTYCLVSWAKTKPESQEMGGVTEQLLATVEVENVDCAATGVATGSLGWTVVGEAGPAGKRRAQLWTLSSAGAISEPLKVAAQAVQPTGTTEGGFYGLAESKGEYLGYGWVDLANGTRRGWVQHIGAAGAPLDQLILELPAASEASPGLIALASPFLGGQWLLGGQSGDGKPWAARLEGGILTSQPFGGASELLAASPAVNGWYLAGNQGSSLGWLERLGPKGERDGACSVQ